MKTWIVTPVYRDVDSFEVLRERLLEELGSNATEARFVVIDDTAGQDEEIERLAKYGDVTVLRPPFNLGHQRAIVYALRKILPRVGDDDAIVTLDADGEDQPSDLPRLLAALQGGATTCASRWSWRCGPNAGSRSGSRSSTASSGSSSGR